ncbi:MAG: DNA lyase [Nitrososphaeraceae archaeon]|nr:DNA lyase [Nitrososphaeraceae archaeon]
MKKVLFDETNLARTTALKELQLSEEGNPFKILIGTILSARTRDENTSKVVRKLFQRYKNAEELASADVNEIKELIRSIGFFNIKAERIKKTAIIINEKFKGKVPDNIEDLIKLPGVGRKTANCVLVYAYNKSVIPVDIHVHRISNRLGLVNSKNPEETEQQLMKIADKKYWNEINNIFVMYGQNVCTPIKPKCSICILKKNCEFYNQTFNTN